MPRLVYTDRHNHAVSYQLRKKIVTIGRSRENDVVLDDPSVAPSHAHVLNEASGFTLTSADAKAIIQINGKVKKSHALKPDDVITIGGLQLSFRMDDAPARPLNAEPPRKTFSIGEIHQRLQSFSEILVQDISSHDLFRPLLDQVIELTGADKGFLVRTENGHLSIPVARNVAQADLERSLEQVSDSIIKRVIDSGEPLIISDALNDTHFGTAQSVVDLKLNSVMCVPLKFRSKLLGVLYLGNDRVTGLFVPEDLALLKVFASQAALILYVAQFLNDLSLDNATLREELKNASLGRIIGHSSGMRAISRTIDKIADTDISVLIRGETGTGKELIAKELHMRSARRDKPFVSINCGAIPENLLESELFGHVKGAFTGAVAHRTGKFESADGGTLFLDEIGEMPLPLQVKLLRVLQERTIEKVGESHPINVDIRVVSATHKDLEQAIKDSTFREDLFYRLNELQLQVPPLRERGEDILLIARYLLDKYCSRYPQNKVKGFSKDALTAMSRYYWPGNVRQLENRIRKAVIMTEQALITPEDLELKSEDGQVKVQSLADAQAEFTLQYIRQVLELNNWNKTKTARDLDVDPRTIFRYLEKIGE